MNGENDRFLADLRGTYRTLWSNGIPVDIVTPAHDWSGYDLVFLSNVALMTDEVARPDYQDTGRELDSEARCGGQLRDVLR